MATDLEKANARIRFLSDRFGILMVVCQSRTGDWNPWMRDDLYDGEGQMGEEIRGWPAYKAAKEVIRNMLRRHDDGMGTD